MQSPGRQAIRALLMGCEPRCLIGDGAPSVGHPQTSDEASSAGVMAWTLGAGWYDNPALGDLRENPDGLRATRFYDGRFIK